MRERTDLEESLGSIGRLERDLDDAMTPVSYTHLRAHET